MHLLHGNVKIIMQPISSPDRAALREEVSDPEVGLLHQRDSTVTSAIGSASLTAYEVLSIT
jgi:hypothetical protein